jgi:hypothetical protein
VVPRLDRIEELMSCKEGFVPIYLELFHGRKSRDEQLDDWGAEGPILGPLSYVHTTYASDIKIQTADGLDGVLSVVGEGVPDVLFYGGMYYGDWSVFGSEALTDELKTRVQQFDSNKAGSPTHRGDNEVCAKPGETRKVTREIQPPGNPSATAENPSSC